MAKNDDEKKGGGSGMGAVLLVICLLVVVSFMGDDHPMDQLADIIIMITWIMAVGLLIFILFFGLAYAMQTAISDLYESVLEDMEHSQYKDKLEEFKVLLDKHIFKRSVTAKKEGMHAEMEEHDEKIEDEPPQNL